MEVEIWRRIYHKIFKVFFTWLSPIILFGAFIFIVGLGEGLRDLAILLLFFVILPLSIIIFPTRKICKSISAYFAQESDISKRRRYSVFQHFLVLPFYSVLLFIPAVFILSLIILFQWISNEVLNEAVLGILLIPIYGLGTLLFHLFFVAMIGYGLWRDEMSGGEKSPDVYKKRRRIFLALFLGALILLIVVIPTLVYLLTPRY